MEKTNINKITWRDLIDNLFGVNNDIETDLIEELKKSHLYDTMNNVNKMAEKFNTPINCADNKSAKNGGTIKKKYNTPTIEVKEMTTEKLEEMRNKLSGVDREI